MECRLLQILDFPTHDIFIGEIIETYCDDDCLNGDVLDFYKINPLLFIMNDRHYWKLGEQVSKAFISKKD